MMHARSLRIPRRGFVKRLVAVPLAGVSVSLCHTRTSGADPTEPNTESKSLSIHTDVPRNAEPHLDKLVASWLTPTELFYVRSHAPVPEIDEKAYRLRVEGLVHRPLSLSLAELRQLFAQISAVTTLTCAGNRRSEHSRVKSVKGVPWREGAIGNARFSGVRLSEVLKKAGVQEGARHVWLEGLDRIDRSDDVIPFGGSIPLEKALSRSEKMPGALLADRMNEKPLTGHHGFPLRAVVPGYIGARSVKWLGRIVVSDRPSPNHYVSAAYKLVAEGTDLEWAEAGPIYRFPVNAAICRPSAGTKVRAGRLTVAGYALPEGHPETTIARVELSADEGRTWSTARLTSATRPFTWQLWKAEMDLDSRTKALLVRATDSRGKTQPRRVPWNLKGYLYNAWHRVPVDVIG